VSSTRRGAGRRPLLRHATPGADHRGRRRRGAVLRLALLTVLVASCAVPASSTSPTSRPTGTDPTTPAPTTSAPPTSPSAGSVLPGSGPPAGDAAPTWLAVEADYPRYLHHVRRVNLETTNSGPADVVITRRVLRAAHFEEVAPVEDRISTVWAGAQVDIQAEFGQVRSCEDVGPFEAWVEYDYASDRDTPPVRAVIPIDPAPLDEIRDRECARQAVLDAVDIRFEDPRIDGSRVTAAIALSRLEGDDRIAVESLLGSVIFTMAPATPGEGSLAEVLPGAGGTTLPVAFEVARCDPHAVGQSTKTYELTLWVAVGDRPAQAVPFTAGPELRNALDSILDECLAGDS
jgi:hypothetical protein